jgi:hypothetical protein
LPIKKKVIFKLYNHSGEVRKKNALQIVTAHCKQIAHRTPEKTSGRCGVRRTLALAGSARECRAGARMPWQ